MMRSRGPGDEMADMQVLEACLRMEVRVQVPPGPLPFSGEGA